MRKIYYIIILFLISSTFLLGQIPTDGLKAYYPFNGNANDESGNGKDGTIGGGVSLTADRFGRANCAFLFNGTNGTISADNIEFDFGNSKNNSVSFWMYWYGSHTQMPFGFNTGYDLFFNSNGIFGINTDGGRILGFNYSGLENRWVHVVAVFVNGTPTTSNVKIYVDGILKTLSGNSNSRNVTPKIVISGWGPDNKYKFGGKLDDFRFYNRELNAVEVIQLFNEKPYDSNEFVFSITDSLNNKKNLTIGLDDAGTDGIDPNLGEESLPPFPPAGIFEARFNLPTGQSSYKDIRGGVFDFVGVKEHQLQIQPAAGRKATINWSFPQQVSGRLQDIVSGSIIDAALTGTGSYTVSDAVTYNKLKLTINYNLTPPTPVLMYPLNNAALVGLNERLKWGKIFNGRKYILQISPESNFNTLTVNDSMITDTSYSLINLENNKKYYWMVSVKNNAGTSSFSSVQSFTTIPLPPNPPLLITPANNAVNQSNNPTLVWQGVNGANKYWLQVAKDDGFVNMVFNDSTLSDTSKTVNDLSNNSYFYWRVAAKNEGGWGNFSIKYRFKTLTIISGIPELISPLNNSVFLPLSNALLWEIVDGASGYKLQVASDTAFTVVLVDSIITKTNYELSGLNPNTAYYWRVCSFNEAGNSQFSSIWKFTTQSTNSLLTIEYLLRISDNAEGKQILKFGLNPFGTDGKDDDLGEEELPPLPPAGVFDARFNIGGNISLLKDYREGNPDAVVTKIYEIQYQPGSGDTVFIHWNLPKNVKGRLNDIITGSLVNVMMIDSGSIAISNPAVINKLRMSIDYKLGLPISPELLLPENSSVDLLSSLNFYWTKREKATFYGIEISNDSTFSNVFLRDTTLSDTIRNIANLEYNTKYFWRVKAGNLLGASDWSEVWSFKTIKKAEIPQLVSPFNNSVNMPVKTDFIWLTAENSLFYNLQIAKDSLFSNIIVNDSSISDIRRNVILEYSTKYFWRVRGKNQGGYGGFSEVWNLTTTVQPVFSTVINITDNGNESGELEFGLAANATDGIDFCYGEETLPPAPPAGTLDLRFELPVNPIESSLKDYRKDTLTNAIWKLKFQASQAGYPFTLRWSVSSLPTGTFILKDNITGNIVNVNMKSDSVLVLSNNGISSLIIEYKKEICKEVVFRSGWNIISVPVNADNMDTKVLFPQFTSPTYAYNNSYQSVAMLSNGKGYWIRYGANKSENICGEEVTSASVNVNSGWNLIGVYDNNISVNGITTNPVGILTSPFYGYVTGYQVPTVLESGKGYWIRANQNGVINLNSTLIAKVNEAPSINEKWTSLTLTDRTGKSSRLYLSEGKENLSSYDLPPVPPEGIFDVRFASDRMVENVSTRQEIVVNSAEYPVELGLEGLGSLDGLKGSVIKVKVERGNERTEKILKDGETILVSEGSRIFVETVEIPREFGLSQNYPNPFNPSTVISYQLPVNSKVTLKLHDVLGNEVTTLVNQEQEAGKYNITFEASRYASGIYFYRLQAGEFVSVKKMVLMK